MTDFEPLPTANIEWGFWGTSVRNGYDANLTWNTTARFLAREFDLNAEQARDVLDSRFGRHLADDLSFIQGKTDIANGPTSVEAINLHLASRIADKGWRDCFENAIREETGKTYPRKKAPSKDELLTLIAQKHLLAETLVTRKSGDDFREVAVWCVKAALEEAFEAGRKSKR